MNKFTYPKFYKKKKFCKKQLKIKI